MINEIDCPGKNQFLYNVESKVSTVLIRNDEIIDWNYFNRWYDKANNKLYFSGMNHHNLYLTMVYVLQEVIKIIISNINVI